jgi:hypothetical protein
LAWPLWPLGAPFDACCVAIVSMCWRDSANGCFRDSSEDTDKGVEAGRERTISSWLLPIAPSTAVGQRWDDDTVGHSRRRAALGAAVAISARCKMNCDPRRGVERTEEEQSN